MYPVKNDNKLYRIFGKVFPDGIHLGKDMGCKIDSEVYAVCDGVVIKTGQFNGYGSMNPPTKGGAVFIKHNDKNNNNFIAQYGHIKFNVNINDNVKKGDVIGYVASFKNKGRSLPHLHFGIHPGKNMPVSPWGYKKKKNLQIGTRLNNGDPLLAGWVNPLIYLDNNVD